MYEVSEIVSKRKFPLCQTLGAETRRSRQSSRNGSRFDDTPPRLFRSLTFTRACARRRSATVTRRKITYSSDRVLFVPRFPRGFATKFRYECQVFCNVVEKRKGSVCRHEHTRRSIIDQAAALLAESR